LRPGWTRGFQFGTSHTFSQNVLLALFPRYLHCGTKIFPFVQSVESPPASLSDPVLPSIIPEVTAFHQSRRFFLASRRPISPQEFILFPLFFSPCLSSLPPLYAFHFAPWQKAHRMTLKLQSSSTHRPCSKCCPRFLNIPSDSSLKEVIPLTCAPTAKAPLLLFPFLWSPLSWSSFFP